jgi:hypothetical protein
MPLKAPSRRKPNAAVPSIPVPLKIPDHELQLAMREKETIIQSFSKTNGTVGVVFYYRNADGQIQVLTGKQTGFLSDSDTHKNLSEREIIKPPQNSFENAEEYFSRRAKDLSNLSAGYKVYYDTVRRFNSASLDGMYFTKYRSASELGAGSTISKLTIIKGGIDATNNGTVNAMLREIDEELGFNANPEKLVDEKDVGDIRYFSYELSDEEIRDILGIIRQREQKHKGELANLSFEPLIKSEINITKYNRHTFSVLKDFYENKVEATTLAPAQNNSNLPISNALVTRERSDENRQPLPPPPTSGNNRRSTHRNNRRSNRRNKHRSTRRNNSGNQRNNEAAFQREIENMMQQKKLYEEEQRKLEKEIEARKQKMLENERIKREQIEQMWRNGIQRNRNRPEPGKVPGNLESRQEEREHYNLMLSGLPFNSNKAARFEFLR